MKKAIFLWPFTGIHLALIVLIFSPRVSAQASFVAISPASATVTLGQSRTFRLVDQNGHMQHSVHWYVSDPEAFDVMEGDELTLAPKQAGNFEFRASAEAGEAEGTIKVLAGDLPAGTPVWTVARVPGCKPMKIIKGGPKPGGPSMYDESQCPDGIYITALTQDGVQLWRRKLGANGTELVSDAPPVDTGSLSAAHLSGSASACDGLSVGMSQQQVRDVLQRDHLNFAVTSSAPAASDPPGTAPSASNHAASDQPPSAQIWTVDEAATQCKLWFDSKFVLAKKRKIFLAE